MKKLLSITLAAVLALSMAACGGSSDADSSAADDSAAETETADDSTAAVDGTVSVFYYTYSDTYISSVRTALDAAFDAAGIAYQDYDSNASQTTQTEQVSTAIAQGTSVLVVNLVDSGSDDAAQNIIDLASAQNIPVIFFNRSVSEEVITSYDGNGVFVGTDYELAGHMQGQLIGEYLVENYDTVDLNGDGTISYVMFKGQEGNAEAIARTQFGVEDANAVLTEAGYPELSFYDESNSNQYLVDQGGLWSSAAANDYMQTILSQYSEANGNMVELVIANNDEMAIGAITALQNAGYNAEGGEGTVIPVFGVDATDAAKAAIAAGTMTGTIKQDAEGMAEAIEVISANYMSGAETFDGIDEANVVGTWRVNIPYGTYTADSE
ncbi:MAG: galactose ABC transporter substrate-binding protein [Clostridiales bacterium]|nr:galactose ABC transporter substrate-binding protein [Clostridiales bacterium]